METQAEHEDGSTADHSNQHWVVLEELARSDPEEGPNIKGSCLAAASPPLERDAPYALQLLQKVREQLVDALAGQALPDTFAAPLSCDFPLKECTRPGFHGFCDIKECRWRGDGTGDVRRAMTFVVRSVSVKLSDEQGQPLPVELLLATFIHELAHAVTRPEMRRVGAVDTAILKLQPQVTRLGMQPDDMVPVHHSNDFYANFATLLRVAERLGIYSLPVGPNKFAPKSLMRFDSIDPAAMRAGLCVGKSDHYATALGAVARPLRVLLTDIQRTKKKPLDLDAGDVSLSRVLKEAKQRLNLRKKPTRVNDAAGKPVEEAHFSQLLDGVLLVVS